MKFDRSTVLTCIVAVMLWSWATGTGDGPSPRPRPLDDRPVLRWIARAAKTLLWVSLMAEKPPAEQMYTVAVHADENGRPALDHGRGW